jgi:predicted anti-sigma-YlaC factor YlaD
MSVRDHRECERVRQLFTAEIDREATELEEAAIRRHLRTCAECAEAYDAHVAVARGLRQHPLVRTRRHPLPLWRRVGAEIWVFVTATVVVAALVCAFALR